MSEIYNLEVKDEMVELINCYSVEYDDCGRIDCHECSFLNDCYYVARQREDGEWAKSLNFGGYETEEEFWQQLLN